MNEPTAGRAVNGAGVPQVTVLIATAARSERAAALRRAIDSAASQSVRPEVLVVANGPNVDEQLYAELERDARVRIVRRAEGSYPAAQRAGRDLVRTAYFTFLDDDDELLPGAIECRLERARAADAPDVVVGRGYRAAPGGDEDYVCTFPQLPPGQATATGSQMMLALIDGCGNWFASSAPLLRTATVLPEYFDGRTKYYEWTLIAFRLLAAGRTMAFVDRPCFRVYDSPSSLSKNPASILSTPAFLLQLLQLTDDPAVRAALRRRRRDAFHAASDLQHLSGSYVSAWWCHLRSLAMRGGLRYLGYTRRLLVAVPRRLAARVRAGTIP